MQVVLTGHWVTRRDAPGMAARVGVAAHIPMRLPAAYVGELAESLHIHEITGAACW